MRSIALLLALASLPAEGAITLIAHSASPGGHTGGDSTAAVNTTGANFLIAAVGAYAGGALAVADTYGNTWTPLVNRGPDTSGGVNRLYYAVNPVTGPGHQVSVSGSGIYATIAMQAFSGVQTTPSAFESQNGSVSGSAASFQAGSVTPNSAGDLLVLGIEQGQAPSISISGAILTDQVPTQGGLNYGVAMAYLVMPSTASQNPVWSPNASTVASLSAAVFSFSSAPATRSTSQAFIF